MRTLHDFSIVTISKLMLLANRCMNTNVDFLIVASKLLTPKLAYIAPWLTKNTTVCVVKSYT